MHRCEPLHRTQYGAHHATRKHPADGDGSLGRVDAEHDAEAIVLSVCHRNPNEDGADAQQVHVSQLTRSKAKEAP